ncbi:MAG: hypothetical protein ACRDNW_02515 [Trebonia sp.]
MTTAPPFAWTPLAFTEIPTRIVIAGPRDRGATVIAAAVERARRMSAG